MDKRILIISLVYYPEFVGGAEVSVREITHRLRTRAFDMIALRGSAAQKEEIVGNVRVLRVGWRVDRTTRFGRACFHFQKYLFPFLAYSKGVSLMRTTVYEAIWSIMANYAGFGALFLKLRFPAIRFLLTLQEGDPISYIKRRVAPVYPLFKAIFKKADAIQAISRYLADFAASMKGRNIRVIPNGVDIAHFTKEVSVEEKTTLQKKLNISDNDTVLVTTSRLVVKNGIDQVVASLRTLPEHYKFLIIGEGDLKSSLQNQVRDSGLAGRVSFLGFLPHEVIPSYFSISDIFIRTSVSEGLGNSFLEAMAAGLPVVATPVGGIPDFLEDGITGILVAPNDLTKIKEGILRLENRELVASIQKNAKALVKERYDWDYVAQQFEALFETI